MQQLCKGTHQPSSQVGLHSAPNAAATCVSPTAISACDLPSAILHNNKEPSEVLRGRSTSHHCLSIWYAVTDTQAHRLDAASLTRCEGICWLLYTVFAFGELRWAGQCFSDRLSVTVA